ncbi:Hypothetical protein CINCED_3A010641 [Cinara cedri]|uniref:Uncharacterized protein n=1 Tax=Cinara cedri TaxID=506608 RepID=A0A5E4NQX2_9HEMI|nr:Hypothetical protein CINCED_3A010641 [Cinara cedri]
MHQIWTVEQESVEVHPERKPRRVVMHFIDNPSRDRRRYIAPAANEVSMMFVGDNGRLPRNVDLVINDTNQNLPGYQMENIPSGSCHGDPMLYPLIFLYRERS